MTIVVQNWYFIQPGREAEGLETRRRASAVRAAAGRPVGRILYTTGQVDGVPSFIWECDYPDQDARDADLAWADASPEFSAVRAHMSTLLADFKRLTFDVV